MYSYLQNRSLFGSASGSGQSGIGVGRRQNQPWMDLSFLLTKFKNFCSDEYSTLDDEGMSVPPMACSFAKKSCNGHILGVVDEDGYLVIYNTRKSGQDAVMKTWQVHANAVFDVEWMRTENHILTASGDQTIALWDMEKCQKLDVFRGHASSVRSVSACPNDDAVFATGSRDGHVMVWDKRIYHKEGAIPPTNSIFNAHTLQQANIPGKARKKKPQMQTKDAQQSVTAVLFQDSHHLVSAGAVDGCIKVWDIRKTYKVMTSAATPVSVIHYPGTSSRKHGYSSLTFSSNCSRLFASCTDDNIYEFNMGSYSEIPVNTFRGHKNSTFYVKTTMSPDDKFLLSGSSDNQAYLWQINKPKASPIVLQAHGAEVTGVAWCPTDFTQIVTLSDDAKTKFWRIYCRELKGNNLPQWFGRGRRVSKERSTSTETTISTERPKLTTSVSLPANSENSQQEASAQSGPSHSSLPSVSRSPSLKEWLKRKLPSNEKSSNSESVVAIKKTSENAVFAKDLSSDISPKKVKTEIETSVSNSDNVNSPFTFDGSSTNRTLHNCEVFRLSVSDSRTECNENDKNLSEDSKCFQNDKGLQGNRENVLCKSPSKKRSSPCVRSPVKSPKRPCLTDLSSNGCSQNATNSYKVKVSLFSDDKSESPHKQELKEDLTSSESEKLLAKDILTESSSSASPNKLQEIRTPSKLSRNPGLPDDRDVDSPTRNLPNLVEDQASSPSTPVRGQSEHRNKTDWLTRLRLERKRRREDEPQGATPNRQPGSTTPRSSKRSKGMRNIGSYFVSQDSP